MALRFANQSVEFAESLLEGAAVAATASRQGEDNGVASDGSEVGVLGSFVGESVELRTRLMVVADLVISSPVNEKTLDDEQAFLAFGFRCEECVLRL